MKNQINVFEGVASRISMHESIEYTIASLNAYGNMYDDWCIAWSGGKDSSTVVTLVMYLIESGKITAPKSLTIMYADTRMELLPLSNAAQHIMDELREKGIDVRVVMAPLEKRFLPYILGRGVPPPNNNTFRWCTRQIKIDPMKEACEQLFRAKGKKVLMITGVRQGESAIRDGRISMSCSKDGAECGQGWFQTTMPEAICDTLAPILHWRVCHVWEWLKHWAPQAEFGDWSTKAIADAYGGDEAEEVNNRTGCVGCPLAQKDTALDTILKNQKWSYLFPLKGLREVYREMRKSQYRLRQTGEQRLKDGSIPNNPNRMGPLTIESRKVFFDKVMNIQDSINKIAKPLNLPTVDILNDEEVAFIKKCWDEKLYPNGWTGDEPIASDDFDQIFRDGSIQKNLFNSQI